MRAGDDTKPAPAIKKKRGKAGMLWVWNCRSSLVRVTEQGSCWGQMICNICFSIVQELIALYSVLCYIWEGKKLLVGWSLMVRHLIRDLISGGSFFMGCSLIMRRFSWQCKHHRQLLKLTGSNFEWMIKCTWSYDSLDGNFCWNHLLFTS
jgi:hypothetical protein